MAVTVQNIVVLCDVTPCSLVGFVSTFSAVPRLQVGRELSSDIVQYTDFTSEFAVFGMSCGLMVNVWLWCKRITNYCIYLQPITQLLANMYIVVNHTLRLIIVAILRENADTEKHFGIEYIFMSADFMRMAMIVRRNVPQE